MRARSPPPAAAAARAAWQRLSFRSPSVSRPHSAPRTRHGAWPTASGLTQKPRGTPWIARAGGHKERAGRPRRPARSFAQRAKKKRLTGRGGALSFPSPRAANLWPTDRTCTCSPLGPDKRVGMGTAGPGGQGGRLAGAGRRPKGPAPEGGALPAARREIVGERRPNTHTCAPALPALKKCALCVGVPRGQGIQYTHLGCPC